MFYNILMNQHSNKLASSRCILYLFDDFLNDNFNTSTSLLQVDMQETSYLLKIKADSNIYIYFKKYSFTQTLKIISTFKIIFLLTMHKFEVLFDISGRQNHKT